MCQDLEKGFLQEQSSVRKPLLIDIHLRHENMTIGEEHETKFSSFSFPLSTYAGGIFVRSKDLVRKERRIEQGSLLFIGLPILANSYLKPKYGSACSQRLRRCILTITEPRLPVHFPAMLNFIIFRFSQ